MKHLAEPSCFNRVYGQCFDVLWLSLPKVQLQGISIPTLFNLLNDTFHDKVGDMIHVPAALGCGDGVDETHLLESLVRDADRHLPPGPALLVHALDLGSVIILLALDVLIHVVLEVLDGQPLTVQEYLDPFTACGHIESSSVEKGDCVGIQLGHVEFGEVGLKCDLGVLFLGILILDYRISGFGHVFCPSLLEVSLYGLIRGLNCELLGENVAELGAKTVAAARGFRFFIAEV